MNISQKIRECFSKCVDESPGGASSQQIAEYVMAQLDEVQREEVLFVSLTSHVEKIGKSYTQKTITATCGQMPMFLPEALQTDGKFLSIKFASIKILQTSVNNKFENANNAMTAAKKYDAQITRLISAMRESMSLFAGDVLTFDIAEEPCQELAEAL